MGVQKSRIKPWLSKRIMLLNETQEQNTHTHTHTHRSHVLQSIRSSGKTLLSLHYLTCSSRDLRKAIVCCSVTQSCLMDSLQLQHTRFPCSSLSQRVCSHSHPLSQWCHPTISSSVSPFLLLLPSIFPSIRVFSIESVLHITWPKYWSFSFSISPSNKYSGLVSFRMDRLDLLAVQGTLKSLL